MRHHNTLLHDLLKFVPWGRFDRLVETHGSDKGVRTLTSKNQFVSLLAGQLSGCDSLRGLTGALASYEPQLYHLGFRKAPACSTLADANAKRPSALYADLFAALLKQLTGGQRRRFGTAVHLIDATTVPLHALSAKWTRAKKRDGAAAKLHVEFGLDAGVPVAFDVSPERTDDITFAKALTPVSGTTYVFDLGYYSFSLWRRLDDETCRFVTRLKGNTKPKVIEERELADAGNIIADRLIRIDHRMTSNSVNPLAEVALREVVVELDTGKRLRLVTNDTQAPAEIIAELYKARWQIELFFKWIKQNLPIRRFLGTSENAVRTQIAIALIAFLLVKLAHQAQQAVDRLIDFMRLVRIHIMSRRPFDRLTEPPPKPAMTAQAELQL